MRNYVAKRSRSLSSGLGSAARLDDEPNVLGVKTGPISIVVAKTNLVASPGNQSFPETPGPFYGLSETRVL